MRSSKSQTLDNWAISDKNIVPDFSGGYKFSKIYINHQNSRREVTQLYCTNTSDNEIDRSNNYWLDTMPKRYTFMLSYPSINILKEHLITEFVGELI